MAEQPVQDELPVPGAVDAVNDMAVGDTSATDIAIAGDNGGLVPEE